MDKGSEHEIRLWAYGTSLAMIALTALMLLLIASAYAAEPTYGPYRATVIKVLDGDTVQLEVGLWPDLKQRINLRLVGVNTPEKRGPKVSNCEKKAGQDATTFTQRWLQGVKEVTISEVRHDKYAGRALGKVRRPDGKDLSESRAADKISNRAGIRCFMIDMSYSLQQSFSRLRWTRITALALTITAAPSLALRSDSLRLGRANHPLQHPPAWRRCDAEILDWPQSLIVGALLR